MSQKDYQEIMKIDEVCDYLRTNRSIVLDFIKEGMPFFTLNKNPNSHKRFKKSDIDEWISKRSC